MSMKGGEPEASTQAPGRKGYDVRFPCKKCGARLNFTPGTKFLTCPFCATENEIQVDEQPVEELDFREQLKRLEEAEPHATVETVKCGACGGEVKPPPNVTSFACPFCGTDIVAESRECSVIRPRSLLPFKVTRDAAADSFRKWIRSRWFAPNALKDRSLIDAAITGLYLPAWTFDSLVDTAYTGQRGDAYYVTVTVMVNGKPKPVQQRRIRWRPASGMVRNKFDDTLVLATKSLPSSRTQALEPWDLNALTPFNADFLAGFTAERYQVDLPEGFGIAQGMWQASIDATIRSDIGGDEQRIESKQSKYLDIRFKHILLPVWVSAYRFHGKVFQFLVNARTGEVQGERPYSWSKISLAVVTGLIFVGVLIWFFANAK